MKRAADPASYMRKAQRALSTARLLLSHGDTEGVCDRAYYAMFNAAHTALLSVLTEPPAVGYKTHQGLIAAFGKHVVVGSGVDPEMGRSLSRVDYFRVLADYVGNPPLLGDAITALESAEIFVEAVRVRFAAQTPKGSA